MKHLVAFLVAFLLSALAVHDASAQGYQCTPTAGSPCSRPQAYAEAQARRTELQAVYPPPYEFRIRDNYAEGSAARFQLQFRWGTQSWTNPPAPSLFYWSTGCPAGTNWDPVTMSCGCPDGSIARGGVCKPCSELNGEPGFLNTGPRVRPFQSMCVAGCMYAAQGPRTCATVGGATTCSGTFEFTGAGCTAAPEQPQQPEELLPHPTEICKPAGSGQTMCIKPSGEQCASTSAGKQICWKPGETGDKTSGDEIQSRRPGTDTSPPTDKPNPPETLQPPYNSVTTTTTVTNNNNTTTTVTTTTTSRRTTNGTDAGDQDDADGGDGGEGDEEGEGGAASGDCSTPPTCTLGESIGCAMLRQSWMNHCGALNGAASPDNSDFSHLNAALPGLATAVPEVWQGDEGGSDGPPTLADVDTSGWAGRGSCPIELQFSIPAFRSYTLDGTWLCHLLDALASLVTIVGMFHAGVILLSGFRKGG